MIYLSNFLETLRALLLENLYCFSSSPFTKRTLILPDLTLKDFLLPHFAHELQISGGLRFTTLAQALEFPTSLELAFFLETEIIKDPPLALEEYTDGAPRRLSQLCDRLSALFIQTAFYGAPLLPWQETLWKKALAQYPELGLSASLEGQQLHLFGFSFLPGSLLEFFHSKGARFYLFSPCQGFWADYASEKEQLFALRRQKQAQIEQKQAYEESFAEQNPLLASFGKLGRKMQDLLLEKSCVEQYVCPEGETALNRLQRQIFLGERGEKICCDNSVQLISTSTRWEELLWLRKSIIENLVQGARPEQMQILAPDISLYAPYIRALFADEKLDLIIEDLPSCQIDPLFQGVLHFFSLPDKRFDKASMQKFLSFPAVQEKFDLKENDLLFLDLEETDFSAIEASHLELVDKCYRLVIGLKEDLADQLRPLSAWAGHFALLLRKYFSALPEPLLHHLRDLELVFSQNRQSISYASAKKMVEEFIASRRESLHPGHLQAVCFSSFSQSITPSSFIYLLGMHEGAFPRRRSSSFSDAAFALDTDRYLFLQLLVSARKKLCISYPRTLPGEAEELEPAFIVQELGLKVEKVEEKLEQKKEKVSVLPTVNTPPPTLIHLRKLSKFVKDPEAFFLSESLGIYEEKPIDESDEFILSPLTKYKLCKKALKSPASAVLEAAELAHELPKHLFKEVAVQRFLQEAEEEQEHLRKLGIAPEELFSVTCSATCKVPQILENGERLFPPFALTLREGQEVKLIGTIEEATMQGLLVRGEGSLLDQMRRMPHFLLFRLLFPEAGEELFLLKKAKKRTLQIEDPLYALKGLVEKYLKGLKGPVVLPPEELDKMRL